MSVSLRNYLTSRIHRAFTVAADDLMALGYIPTEEDRIALSSAIGQSLSKFREQVDGLGGWLDDPIDVDGDRDVLFQESIQKILDGNNIDNTLSEMTNAVAVAAAALPQPMGIIQYMHSSQKICPECNHVEAANIRYCPKCGYDYHVKPYV